MVSSLLKAIKWCLLFLIGIPFLFYLVLVLCNFNDEEKSEKLVELEQRYIDETVSKEENAYYFAVAMNAPKNADSFEWAQQQTHHAIHTKNTPDKINEVQTIDTRPLGMQLQFLFSDCSASKFIEVSCVQALANKPKDIQEILVEWNWLYQRYLVLISKPYWEETTFHSLDSTLISWKTIDYGKKLHFLHTWLALQSENTKIVLANISQEHDFLTSLASNSQLLISRMMSLNYLQDHYLQYVHLLNLATLKDVKFIPEAWLNSMPNSAWQLSNVLEGEFLFSMHLLKTSLTYQSDDYKSLVLLSLGADIFLMPLFQLNATGNALLEKYKQSAETYNVEYNKLPALLKQLNNEPLSGDTDWLSFLPYNPVGKILLEVTISPNTLIDYVAKGADIEGIRQLSLLALSLHSMSLSSEQTEAFIKNSDYRSPYNQLAFYYDPSQQVIWFDGLLELNEGDNSINNSVVSYRLH